MSDRKRKLDDTEDTLPVPKRKATDSQLQETPTSQSDETPSPTTSTEITMTQSGLPGPPPQTTSRGTTGFTLFNPTARLMGQGLDDREKEDLVRLRDIGFNITETKAGVLTKLGMGAASKGVYAGTYGPKIIQTRDQYRSRLEGVSVGGKFAAKYIVVDNQTDNLHDIYRVISEKQILNEISHSNIVRLRMAINLGQHRALQWPDGSHRFDSYSRTMLIMDMADHKTLLNFIFKGEINVQVVFDKIMCDVCYGIQYLHNKQISHGDIHKGNVLIYDNTGATGPEDKYVAKWTDFGLSYWFGHNPNPTKQLTRDQFEGVLQKDFAMLSEMIKDLVDCMPQYHNPLHVNVKRWHDLHDYIKVNHNWHAIGTKYLNIKLN